VELLRVVPGLEGHLLHFATVSAAYAQEVAPRPLHVIPDATAWERGALVRLAIRLFVVMVRVRPDFVISTGAAPGLLALAIGKLFGARTIWLDSLANVDELSRSGRLARRFADLWLTQWPHLATPDGPEYAGAVL
jgi:hypothetical protein